MLDIIEARSILREMGIESPAGVDDPILGQDLGMEQLEIRRFRQIVEMRWRILMPDDFHISRSDTVSGLVRNINACYRSARAAYDERFGEPAVARRLAIAS
jgi:hypothetical protein